MDTHLPRNNKKISFKYNKFVVKLGLHSQKLKKLSDTFYFLQKFNVFYVKICQDVFSKIKDNVIFISVMLIIVHREIKINGIFVTALS